MSAVNIRAFLAAALVLALPALVSVSAMAYPQIYIIAISRPEGLPGTEVRVFGGGATPNGTVVALLLDSAVNMTLGEAVADANGYWQVSFVVPNVQPGGYAVCVVDRETLSEAKIAFTVLPPPSIKIEGVSPSAGSAGTIVYVRGSCATPNGFVRLYFDHTNVAETLAYAWGGWDASFTVPDVEPGNYTITALDVTSNTTDTAVFIVTPPPQIRVVPSAAPIGSKVTITGEEFPPRTGLYIFFEDQLLFSPIYTDDKGKFNVTLFVPAVNSGNYTLKAVSTMYGMYKPLATANFTVTAGLDTLFKIVNDAKSAANQAQSAAQSACGEASSAREAAGKARDEAIAAKEAAGKAQEEAATAKEAAGKAQDAAVAAKEAVESVSATANEARVYALIAMIFAIIAAALSATALFRKGKQP